VNIDRLDHLVLTVRNVEATCAFSSRVLGMKPVTFGAGRRALSFGCQKINLHPADAPFAPHADHPLSGSADLCFIATNLLAHVIAHLQQEGVPIIEGPVSRAGALGAMMSVYIRDPDANLIEISEYDQLA
jgi:catechol 2,3-dioxygenase-like lactoylglutathione lyase family enzyme